MTKYDKAVSVCFSGHRSVPFAKRRELKQCLKSEIAKAYADGYRYFYCGMAMGFCRSFYLFPNAIFNMDISRIPSFRVLWLISLQRDRTVN